LADDRRALFPIAEASARGLAQSGFNEIAFGHAGGHLVPSDLTETLGLEDHTDGNDDLKGQDVAIEVAVEVAVEAEQTS